MKEFRQDNERKMRDFAKLEAANLSRREIASILSVGTSTLNRWEYHREFMNNLYLAGGSLSRIRCTFEVYAIRTAQGKTDVEVLIDLLLLRDGENRKSWLKRFKVWKKQKHFESRLEEYKDSEPAQTAAEERLWIQRLLEAMASDGDTFSKERCSFELYAVQRAQGKDDSEKIIEILAYDSEEDKEKWQKRFANWKQRHLQARLDMYHNWEHGKAEAEKRWLQRLLEPKKTPDIIDIQLRYALRQVLEKLHSVRDIEAFCLSIETGSISSDEIRTLINNAAAACQIRTFQFIAHLRDSDTFKETQGTD